MAGGIPEARDERPSAGGGGYEGTPGNEVAGEIAGESVGEGVGEVAGEVAAPHFAQKLEAGAKGTPQRGQFMNTSRG